MEYGMEITTAFFELACGGVEEEDVQVPA